MRRVSASLVGVAMLSIGACSGGGSAEVPAGGRTVSDVRDASRWSAQRAAMREDAIASLLELTRSPDAQTRANALEALELAPLQLDAVAAASLLDENVGVRSIAAVAVGRAGLRGHEAALRAMLADESGYARASAIFALAKLGLEVDLTPLAAFLIEGKPSGLRGHTAYLLGELGDPAGVDLLRAGARSPMDLLSHAERRVVELQISEAMVKLGDRQQLGPIRAALFPSQASDLEAMALAIQIVGEIGDSASRGRLVQIAETTDNSGQTMPAEVQLAIAISMGKLGDRNGWFVADQYWDESREVLRADSAAVYGWSARDQDLQRLKKMLGDESGRVRVSAAAGILRATGGSSGSVRAPVS